ncbi:tyrosine-type recombinase/integrase, partial [Streptomyces sp. MK37H]|nr:tyrosine-type recombinase/integrase [Streptomyces sp. MK37H]
PRTTSTWRKASSTCAAPSPRSTTTGSSSPHRRPGRAASGWPSHPASPPPSGTTQEQRLAPAVILASRHRPVFGRPDGRPLGPHQVLDLLHQLSEEAGAPRITVHDLRQVAATIAITAGVPLTVVSKTLRHSILSKRRQADPPPGERPRAPLRSRTANGCPSQGRTGHVSGVDRVRVARHAVVPPLAPAFAVSPQRTRAQPSPEFVSTSAVGWHPVGGRQDC